MLTLLKTFLDISVLRKGPDSLPPARLVLGVAIGLWLTGIAMMGAISSTATLLTLTPAVVGWASSMLLFALVIRFSGFPQRLVQSLSAIAGAGSVILFGQVLSVAVLTQLGQTATSNLIVEVLSLWAVFVKGYIIAAALEIRPILGVGISLLVFIVRMLVFGYTARAIASLAAPN